jgi:predicted nucleic acid-binding protein
MIIDTMVVAYALLGVPEFGQESLLALRKADTLYSPASIEAELLNVIWQWGTRGIPKKILFDVYSNASRLWTKLIPVEQIWTEALNLALSFGHSPYDTLFIAAARQYNSKVITYDKKLLSLFPNDAIKPNDFLNGLK